MKTQKIGLSFTALLLCLVMLVSLAACGAVGGSDTDKLNRFIESAQGELENMRASFGDTVDVKLEARDKSLVYIFQYKEDTGLDNETLKQALDSAMEGMSSTFTTVLSAVKGQVASVESVIVEYLDKDGELITSIEFK